MAALVKEILIDLAANKIVHHDDDRLIESGHSIAWEYLPGWEQHCETKCDIQLALDRLLKTAQVDSVCYNVLIAFMAGFSIEEIAIPGAREMLIQLLGLLEAETQYSDDRYLESVVRKYPKYSKTKEAYRNLLTAHGRTFE